MSMRCSLSSLIRCAHFVLKYRIYIYIYIENQKGYWKYFTTTGNQLQGKFVDTYHDIFCCWRAELKKITNCSSFGLDPFLML